MHEARVGSIVVGLGIGQVMSWGMLIYAIAVLGSSMASDLQMPTSFVFGAFSAALLTSGLAAPSIGNAVDRFSGRTVLRLGSLLSALGFVLLAFTRSPIWFFIAWLLLGVAMSMSLYEVAFATLSQHVGHLRRAITAVTLFGGFASTVFFPLSLQALQHFGWRNTTLMFAALQLLVNVPLYSFAIPLRATTSTIAEPGRARKHPAHQLPNRGGIALLAIAFAGGAFVTSSIAAHVVNILTTKGLSLEQAVWIAALIGPMQVAGRIVELALERRVGIKSAAISAFAMLVLSMVLLGFAGAHAWVACGFVALYGVANGVITIARGAVPAEIFGRARYGAVLGRISAPSFIARSFAPFVVSLGITRGHMFGPLEFLLLGVAGAALVTFILALKSVTRLRKTVQPHADTSSAT